MSQTITHVDIIYVGDSNHITTKRKCQKHVLTLYFKSRGALYYVDINNVKL